MEVLGYLAEGAERFRVKVHYYVLMENHFHLVATTPEGNFQIGCNPEDRVRGLLQSTASCSLTSVSRQLQRQ